MPISEPSSPLHDQSFLIVGLVRNCEGHIRSDVQRLQSAFAGAGRLQWLLIESDSSDATVSHLDALTRDVPGFRYLTLGELRRTLPSRTERIAFCRNAYVQEAGRHDDYRAVDYVVVSDFDGLNTRITRAAVESCWERDGWDVCTANQDGPYYDIWALRHEVWCPHDCWRQYEFLNRYSPDTERNLYASVHSKMITIPPTGDWIEVDSAFGGLAIYRKHTFRHAGYVGRGPDGEPLCEHVPFHKALKAEGCRIYINPRLINAGMTEHTKELLLSRRLERRKKQLKGRIKSLIRGTLR